MSIRLALPGNRYLPHSQLLLRRLGAYEENGLPGRFKFDGNSCPITAFVTKARDTLSLVCQAAVDLAIVPDEWLFEYQVTAPDLVCVLGPVPWLNARLSFFGLPPTYLHLVEPRSIITPFPNMARKECEELGFTINKLLRVSGTTEIFIPNIADLGFDIVETGATLTSHGLAELHIVHTQLSLSLVCRNVNADPLNGCVGELLREAYEARILKPA